MEQSTNLQNTATVVVHSNENRERRKKRSSLVNRSKSATSRDEHDSTEFINDHKDEPPSSAAECDWRQLYIKQVTNECNNWKNVLRDAKHKYNRLIKKSNRPQAFGESLLTQEEKDFLNDNGMFRELAQNLIHLKDEVQIGKLLKLRLVEKRKRVASLMENDVSSITDEIYKSTLEISYDDFVIDDQRF